MALSGCSMRALLSGPSFLGEAEGGLKGRPPARARWRPGRPPREGLSWVVVPAGSLSLLLKGNSTMSGGLDVLQMKEEDVLKFLAAGTHLGGTNLDFQMEQYIYKRKSDGRSLGWESGLQQLA